MHDMLFIIHIQYNYEYSMNISVENKISSKVILLRVFILSIISVASIVVG
jgi:hypothetical protein